MRFTARAAIAAIAIATLWTAGPACSQPGLTLPARPDAATDKFASLDKAARRTISVACSKEADEQGLKGKARGKFRSACKRDKAAAAAAAATPVPAPAPTPEKPK
ncbi:PsiF family protein [Bradyrhizobium sp. SZCCHNRI3043]|uniref:PsiF family protein n=1 Tax=Bradyrhizobium sp. SZCCHNRI3043 TaxID=3057292 RepID=UPI0028F0FFA9|nr:PsiF family protein [Bradyrhizobium sp. SZCCHNRI3043]